MGLSDTDRSLLACPICHAPLTEPAAQAGPRTLVCTTGHAFDRAKAGYVTLFPGRRPAGVAGDSADMVAARARFLAAGHFAPLQAALAEWVRPAGGGVLLEIGCGSGDYLHALCRRAPAWRCAGLDISKAAARRAARRVPSADIVVADAWSRWPFLDGVCDIVLHVFAPRNAADLRRVLRPGGMALFVIPQPEHLQSLRVQAGLIDIEPDKRGRLLAQMEGFSVVAAETLSFPLSLDAAAARDLVQMGPSARHLDVARLDLGAVETHAAFEIVAFA